MEKFPHGSRHSLLGSSPRDPYASPDSSSNSFLGRRKSGVDFDDVFGGPPTRAASYDGPAGAAFSRGGSGRRGDWEEEAAGVTPRRPWVSLGEKPVFGERFSPSSRRKGLVMGEDFYSDIFRGSSESHCSTPRKLDWDALSSTPGSRVLSPARPLPGKWEAPAGSGSPSLTSQHSISKRMSKGSDYPAFGSTQDQYLRKLEGGDLDSISNMEQKIKEVFHTPDEQKTNNNFVSPHFRDLSHQFSHEEDKIRETDVTAATNFTELIKEASNHSKATNNDGQVFHFSIYSWVSRGVMLVVPSKSNDRRNYDGRLSGLPVPVLHGADLPFKEPSLQREEGLVSKPAKEGNILDHEIKKKDPVKLENPVEETLSAKLVRKDSDAPFSVHNASSQSRATKIPGILNELLQPSVIGDVRASKTAHNPEKPAEKSLKNLLNDHSGIEEIDRAKEKGSLSNTPATTPVNYPVELDKQKRKEATMDHFDSEKVQTQLYDEMLPGRVKGKVKEFVKIFSQDVPRKPMNFVEPRGRSPKVNEEKKVEEPTKICTPKVDKAEKVHLTKEHGEKINNAIELEQTSRTEKMDSSTIFDKRTETFSHERHNLERVSSEFSVENIEVSCINVEEANYDVEECLVELLDQEDDKLSRCDTNQEIQNADTKIRQWSKGKEGNIRSLLSTLQYVLWPGSKWKPVPLVDIIEGASVRKAYQKALLALHPDKLQQRGAPEHHKYIAEKVFDILQEAWDHFNSSSSLL